jgi:hypothetical protein
MSLPVVNATTKALNESPKGTTELYGKIMLGLGGGVAAICAVAFIYSKMTKSNNAPSEQGYEKVPENASSQASSQALGGTRRKQHTHRKQRTHSKKSKHRTRKA